MGAGKRGIVIDLKIAQGVEVALAIVKRSDVVLQSMRPGVADRIGIGEAAVRAVNPDILYYDVSAFGDGADRPRHAGLRSAGAGLLGHHGR